MNRRVLSTETSCIRRFTEWAAGIEGCIGLTLGEPDFDTPEEITDRAKEALDLKYTHYPPSGGVFSLRKEISVFEELTKGFEYSPEEIMITNGATEGVAIALKAILNPGDETIIFTPAFGLYRPLIEMYGGKCIAIDTSEDGFNIIEAKICKAISKKTKCIILNYPNNPTGRILQRNTADMLHSIIKERNIFVICDEVYCDLVYEGESTSLATYKDIKEKIIVIKSFSKPYAMTGWRIGYLMAEKEIIKEIFKVHQYTVAGISHFSQIACVEALKYNVTKMRDSYRARTEYVFNRLSNIGFELEKPQSTFYIFPSLKKFNISGEQFCQELAEKQKVVMLPSECFEIEGYARISCCYEQNVLEKAMDRIETFVTSDLKGNGKK